VQLSVNLNDMAFGVKSSNNPISDVLYFPGTWGFNGRESIHFYLTVQLIIFSKLNYATVERMSQYIHREHILIVGGCSHPSTANLGIVFEI